MQGIPRIISADDHVVEPPDLWTARLRARYRDVGPRIERRRVKPNGPRGGISEADDGEWADLKDPYDRTPNLWFQESGDEEGRQRWHPDIWVDPSQVQPRIDAALAAGGSLVSEEHAPSFWVLADPQGNRACLCTWQERG